MRAGSSRREGFQTVFSLHLHWECEISGKQSIQVWSTDEGMAEISNAVFWPPGPLPGLQIYCKQSGKGGGTVCVLTDGVVLMLLRGSVSAAQMLNC